MDIQTIAIIAGVIVVVGLLMTFAYCYKKRSKSTEESKDGKYIEPYTTTVQKQQSFSIMNSTPMSDQKQFTKQASVFQVPSGEQGRRSSNILSDSDRVDLQHVNPYSNVMNETNLPPSVMPDAVTSKQQQPSQPPKILYEASHAPIMEASDDDDDEDDDVIVITKPVGTYMNKDRAMSLYDDDIIAENEPFRYRTTNEFAYNMEERYSKFSTVSDISSLGPSEFDYGGYARSTRSSSIVSGVSEYDGKELDI